ncbi:TetR/AcrR family transcriptional regulator [Cellulomonas carbonis]|nr:TetR/AcrR family transcriptional regulator [Cellulomonas carbonis]
MERRAVRRPQRPRETTVRKREEILRAATATFGNRGYKNGSLAEIADQVGITHTGVLHHFGSKDQLLLEVLAFRDRTDVEQLEDAHVPGGLELFRHLVATARRNAGRPGLVQTYTVLSAEAVTDGHPGKDYFRERYTTLRGLVADALREVCADDDPPPDRDVDAAAAAVLAVMDGLQVQWLLEPGRVDLPHASAFAIEAILSAAVHGRRRASLLDP